MKCINPYMLKTFFAFKPVVNYLKMDVEESDMDGIVSGNENILKYIKQIGFEVCWVHIFGIM